MSTWSVHRLQGRLPDGTHADLRHRRAKAWFVRWRVDGRARRRTFVGRHTRGHSTLRSSTPRTIPWPQPTAREGHLPEDPAWLGQVLRVSDALITDMMAWCDDMDRFNARPSLRTKEAWVEMNRRGRVLAQRLQAEVGANYVVQFKS